MSKSSKPPKDPEGRMALADHLRELRNRLVKSVLAIVLLTIIAGFFHKQLMHFILAPLPNCSFQDAAKADHGHCAVSATIGLLTPFTLTLKVCLTAGLVASTPVWLYQLWSFVTPGLHQHERRYSLGFLAVGTPLFLAGATFAYLILPSTARVLVSFTPTDVTPIMPAENYLDIATRMVVVFGLAFELPLLLVMLNFGGVLSGKRLLGWWRGMVMGITVFAAFATPSADPVSMLALAAPIWVLYFMATGVALLNDRRRARRNPDAGLSDEEASHLDLSVEEVASAESVEASVAPAAPAPVPAARQEQMDDIT